MSSRRDFLTLILLVSVHTGVVESVFDRRSIDASLGPPKIDSKPNPVKAASALAAKDVGDDASLKCDQFADTFQHALLSSGVSFVPWMIYVTAPSKEACYPKRTTQGTSIGWKRGTDVEIIGHDTHFFTQVQDRVYDNLHPGGISIDEFWTTLQICTCTMYSQQTTRRLRRRLTSIVSLLSQTEGAPSETPEDASKTTFRSDRRPSKRLRLALARRPRRPRNGCKSFLVPPRSFAREYRLRRYWTRSGASRTRGRRR